MYSYIYIYIYMIKTYIIDNRIFFPYTNIDILVMDIDLNCSDNIYTILSKNKNVNFTIKNNISKTISYINYNNINNQKTLKNILENNSIIINWTLGKLICKDNYKIKTYNVYMYKLSDYSVIIKPEKKYKCSIYEHIFDFGFKSENYDSNKIINININNK